MPILPANRRPAIAEFLANEFGGYFREQLRDVVVGLSVVEVVPLNYERVGLVIVNLGGTDVIVRPGPAPTLTSGIRLGAGGGAMTVNVREDMIMSGLQWSGISSVAGQTVFALEVVRDIRPEGSEIK